MTKRLKGLTLTELLIVLALIAFLILIAISLARRHILKGRDARRKGDVKTIQIAVEEYEKDKDCYPSPQLVTCEPGDGLSPYLGTIPCDPATKQSYYYDVENPDCPQWYRIYAKLENESDVEATASCGLAGEYNYVTGSPNSPACNLSESSYYGCKAGFCVPILWDEEKDAPECSPNSTSPNCDGRCGSPTSECKSL